jgi:gamma-glutamyltranspeptidase/glutathione hydrolase
MWRAYADRNTYVGDPDFMKVPIAGLLDPAYLAKRRASIGPQRATSSSDVAPGHPAGSEHTETTHYSIVDAEGNGVADLHAQRRIRQRHHHTRTRFPAG